MNDDGLRQDQALPRLSDFKQWMDKTLAATSAKSDLAKAILYSCRQWAALTRYAENGRIKIDNNAAEREIRAVALGRKTGRMRAPVPVASALPRCTA